MSFWSTKRLVFRQSQKALVEPFNKEFAKQGAYELSLGPDAFVTTEPNATKQTLEPGEQLVIPPGQFGLLLTEEVVTIPNDVIGFISVRFTIKRRGLVNVSGFHVDPGFTGRLKFAVYNAGSQNIILSRGERVFMIWFSDLTEATPDPYEGGSAGQNQITSQDVMFISGEVASPAALKKQIEDLKSEYERRLTVLDDKIGTWRSITIGILTSLIVGVVVGVILLMLRLFVENPSPQPLPTEGVRPAVTIQESDRNSREGGNNNSFDTKPSNTRKGNAEPSK